MLTDHSLNRLECLICITETINMEKNLSFFATEDLSQDLIFDCLLHCPLFYLVIVPASSHLHNYNYLSSYIFFHFYFVPRRYFSLFVIIARILSVFLVVKHFSSVSFYPIQHLSDYTFIEHFSLPNLTVVYSFNCLSFVTWVSAFIRKLINHVTDRNA